MDGVYSLYYMNRCIGRDITRDELICLMNEFNLHWKYNEETKEFEVFKSCYWVYRDRPFFE